MNIINTSLSFGSLSKRGSTNKIIGHHADAPNCTVQDIHNWHKNNGWSGIGYHLLIRKNGEVYQGRPLDTLGAHTLGQNSDSIGICLEGRLTQEKPTQAQINSLKEVLYYLRGIYGNLPFKGHKDYMATDCPGFLMDYMGELNSVTDSRPSKNTTNNQHQEVSTGVVTANSGLNVRSGAGTNYSILGTIAKGQKVKIRGTVGKWYNIDYSSNGGWVSADYVKVENNTPSTPTITNTSGNYGEVTASVLNVRKGAGTNYNVIGQLKQGEKVRLANKVGNWWSIYYGTNGGFVSADYIKQL